MSSYHAHPHTVAALAVARATQSHDPARIAAARAELTAVKVRTAIEAALNADYPPTPQQCAELADLIAGGGSR